MPTAPYILRKIQLCQAYNEDWLNLNSLELTEFPPEVFELTHLKTLNLHYNAIQTIPEDIVKLKNLEILGLERNHITQISPVVATFLHGVKDVTLSLNTPASEELKQTTWTNQALELIENADLEAAFDLLENNATDKSTLTLLKFRFNAAKKAQNNGTIDQKEYDLAINQVVVALLDLVNT